MERNGTVREGGRKWEGLTHCPTVDSQPMMEDWTQACDRILAPRSTVDLERHTPKGEERRASKT